VFDEAGSQPLVEGDGHPTFVTGTVVPIDGGQAAGNKPPHMYRQGQPMQAPSAGG
jgi:hypothetical protein